MGKTSELQTKLVEDTEYKRKMAEMDRLKTQAEKKMEEDIKEIKACAGGPFKISIKDNNGKIEVYSGKSLWRSIFSLGCLLEKQYSGQFLKGVVVKLERLGSV